MRVIELDEMLEQVDKARLTSSFGYITRVVGLVIESRGPEVSIGELCLIEGAGAKPIRAEVIGFDNNRVLLMPIGSREGINPGAKVLATGDRLRVRVGSSLLGKVLNGMGEPIQGEYGPGSGLTEVPIHRETPNPLTRQRIKEPLSLGIRSVDGLLTFGKGQRIGIFAGSGVGKSTLLGMAARNTTADINVIGLIGERGREVREFIERDLGPAGLERSIVVTATSDQPALVRVKAAYVTTAIAEYFRDQGEDVLLMLDSITRIAMALREVGLAVGEPPATRGYPPSVFAELPRLLERAGAGARGTISALYTVLVEGDDFNEPVSDTVRGILDGHIALSRELASRNHYPAVDIMESVSRVMPEVTSRAHQQAAAEFRRVIADYREAEDLINIGAYQSGSNPAIDKALSKIDSFNTFLRQGVEEKAEYAETVQRLEDIVR